MASSALVPAVEGKDPAELYAGPLVRPKDLLRTLIVFAVIMNVSRMHQHYGWLGAMRPGLLTVAASTALAFMTPRFFDGAPGLKTWIARAIAMMAAIACLSAPFGISFGATAKNIIEEYWKVLFVTLLVIGSIRTPHDLWYLLWAYLAGCAFLLYLALFVFMPQPVSQGAEFMRLEGLYKYDGNDLCVVLLVGLPMALLAIQVARNKIAKILAMAIAVGIVVVVAKTGSRGGFLGMATVFAALLFLADGISGGKRVGILMVAFVALSLAAPPGYWKQMNTVVNPKEDYNWNSDGGRRKLWMRGLSYMWAYPLFGVGMNNFGRAEGTISDRARNHSMNQPGIKWAAPHNTFVQAGAEMGVTGMIVFCSLVFGGIYSMVMLRKKVPREWARGSPQQRLMYLLPAYLAVAMVAYASAGFFVSHAYMDHFYVLLAMMAGLYGMLHRRKRSRAPSRGRQRSSAPVPGGFIAPPATS